MTKPEPFQFEHPKNFLRSANVGAIYSDPVKTYRYAAWKMWDIHLPYINFLLDWPGVTEEPKQDAVLTELAERVGQQWAIGTRGSLWGGVVVTCLYAHRAPSLVSLAAAGHADGKFDPVGVPKNTEAVARFAQQAGMVVIGWDAKVVDVMPGVVAGTLDLLRSMFVSVYALQVDGIGVWPVHPLRTPVSRRPVLFGV